MKIPESGNHVVPTEWAQQLERERDEAIKKIQRQAERIRQLEGATNHAGGTPLSIALRERDEAREERDDLKQELKIVTARLHGKKHPLDNGIPERREIYIWKNGKYELDP